MDKRHLFLTLLAALASVGISVASAAYSSASGADAHGDSAHGAHDAHGTEQAHAAEGDHEEGHHHIPLPKNAVQLSENLPFISNSYVATWLAVLVIVFFCRAGAGKLSMIPRGFQNFAEWVIESLYGFFEGVLGEHLVKRTFWFFGSVFLLIIVNNYLGLIPGVGTVGWDVDAHNHVHKPLLRGGNADVNMTSAMALTFALLWFFWAITENGLKGFLAHIFAPKGKFKGLLLPMMILIFGVVGFLEVISIAIRPLALSFRLFGNIYGGEQTLELLMGLGGTWFAWLSSLPFYFIELLVGGVQALVFSLLCAVFLKLICEHDEHHDEEGAH